MSDERQLRATPFTEIRMRDRTKAEQREWLQARGWTPISKRGSEAWLHNSYGEAHFFTLAAAYQTERKQGD